jgi:hypothetical protein
MAYFRIHYGGTGRSDIEDIIEADDLITAEEIAYGFAIDDYESYAGLHGIPSRDDIAQEMYGNSEDDTFDSSLLTPEEWQEVEVAYSEEMESWVDYWAEEISEEEFYYELNGEEAEEDEE